MASSRLFYTLEAPEETEYVNMNLPVPRAGLRELPRGDVVKNRNRHLNVASTRQFPCRSPKLPETVDKCTPLSSSLSYRFQGDQNHQACGSRTRLYDLNILRY